MIKFIKIIFTSILYFLALSSMGGEIKIDIIVEPSISIIEYICIEPNPSGPTASLNRGKYSTVRTHETVYPGSIQIQASGGTPPYNYNWHGIMVSGSTCSSMSGNVIVTISDSNGYSIRKKIKVKLKKIIMPSPCGGNSNRSLYTTTLYTYPKSINRNRTGNIPIDYRNRLQRIPPGPSGGGKSKTIKSKVPSSKAKR